MDLKDMTIKKARAMLDSKEISPRELFDAYKANIEAKDKKLNAYITTFDYQEPQPKGNPDALRDIPCAVKDVLLIEGTKCTAGSRILENYISPYTATSMQKLKDAGVPFLGKANCDEFTMGTTGETSYFGPTLNPHDTTRASGGSSSGPAVAVAADMAPYAIGTDTGGSNRAPACWSGVVGFKPSYGRVSRYGEMPMASSFDQQGTLTKTVEDAALAIETISGHDPKDASSVDMRVPHYIDELRTDIKGKKIGVPKEFFGKGLDPQMESLIRDAIKQLESLGCHIEEVSLPMTDYGIAAYYLLVPSEISANMARYDGIRYGHHTKDAQDLMEVYAKSRDEGLGPEVKRRIMIGTYALSAGYYDAYYKKAAQVRTLVRNDFKKLFETYDAIVGPVMPSFAPKLGELVADPLATYLADIYTVQVNMAGLPAISVPCGFGDIAGSKLPAGLHIIGKQFDELTVLQIAHAYEQSQK